MLEPAQAIEDGQRLVARRALVDRRFQQAPGFVAVASSERRQPLLQQLLGFSLPLGERAPRALDVRASPRVAAIEKQRARPDVDGVLVLGGEVVIQTDEQELLDLRVPIRLAPLRRAQRIGSKGIRHQEARKL